MDYNPFKVVDRCRFCCPATYLFIFNQCLNEKRCLTDRASAHCDWLQVHSLSP